MRWLEAVLLFYGTFNFVFGCFIGNLGCIMSLDGTQYDPDTNPLGWIFPITIAYFVNLFDYLNLFGKIAVTAILFILALPTIIATVILSCILLMFIKIFKALFVRGE